MFRAFPRSLWDPTGDELQLVVILVVATILYLAYQLAIGRAVVARLFPIERRPRVRGDEVRSIPMPPTGELVATASVDDSRLRTRIAFWRRGLGALLFGLVPAVAVAMLMPGGLAASGLALGDLTKSAWMSGAFFALTLPFVVLQARKPNFRAHYPEVRVALVGRIAMWNFVSWAAYLTAYELFFRGFLVLGIAPLVGPLPAIAISLMGYVFVHLGKHPGEAVGTLLSGTWFGVVALESGSVLGPIVAHLAVALATDYFASRPVRTEGTSS